MRQLGVPVVIDRMLQQAVGQVLCNHYDAGFSDYSYGFRPHHNAHQAVMRSLEYINGGNVYIVDMDLKNFFDEVDHCLLLQILYRKVKCRQTLRLIRKWLRVPIQINGKLVKRRKGVPQGSPLSPILSNVMLNELDKELERLGVKYVRYADDFSLYFKDEKEARHAGNRIYLYLRDKLHLAINREKSGIRRPEEFVVLGYGFESIPAESGGCKYQLVVSAKRWKTLKQNLKEITRKTRPYSFDARVRMLGEVQRGWLHYFGLAHMYRQLQKLDGWVRNRLRYCIWHNWKKPKRRCKNLLRLGVNPTNARKWSNTRMGGWATARSPILKTTITIARLQKRGYEAMFPLYQSIAPYLNEPLYTRPVRTVV
jgi:group II intron reverse transcriptase/maturase